MDYGAVIQKIRKAGADGIIFGGYHPEASKLVQQLAKKKIDIPFIGPDGVKDEQFIKVAGKNAEGVYATGPTDVSKLPMNIQAHENHKKKYGTEPGAFYDNAYSATVALLECHQGRRQHRLPEDHGSPPHEHGGHPPRQDQV